MKRLLILVMAVALLFSFTACKEDNTLQENEKQKALESSGYTESGKTKGKTEKSISSTDIKPITYTGSGDSVLEIESIKEGYVFYIEGNKSSRHFAVKGYDANGKSTGLFVNTTDTYKGITIDSTLSTVTLEISAVGSWSVELRPFGRLDTISKGETLKGSGDDVILVLSYGNTADISGNAGEHHFAVKSYGKNGNNLMVNTTDKYRGTVMLKNAPTLLEVNAEGDWSITFN